MADNDNARLTKEALVYRLKPDISHGMGCELAIVCVD